MIQAIKDFHLGIWSFAIGWKVWLLALIVVNFFIPAFFIQTIEAQVTIAVFFASAMTGMVLVKVQGFTRLLGLMHIYWIPLVICFAGKLDTFPATDPFGQWLRALIILNGISLAIDLVDVIRYLRGERKPIWPLNLNDHS